MFPLFYAEKRDDNRFWSESVMNNRHYSFRHECLFTSELMSGQSLQTCVWTAKCWGEGNETSKRRLKECEGGPPARESGGWWVVDTTIASLEQKKKKTIQFATVSVQEPQTVDGQKWTSLSLCSRQRSPQVYATRLFGRIVFFFSVIFFFFL